MGTIFGHQLPTENMDFFKFFGVLGLNLDTGLALPCLIGNGFGTLFLHADARAQRCTAWQGVPDQA